MNRCPNDGYALIKECCPVCAYVTPPTEPVLPDALRQIRVTREMFISQQHYEAWLKGKPLRRHLLHRKKMDRDFKDRFFSRRKYLCSFCPSTSLLTVDHILPSVLGGSSNDCNCRPACGPCNRKQWSLYADYLRQLDRWEAAA